ncbi:MAG: hypothetical protein S4CHLAM6_08290 [Chlamydiae bacterium]|nr:hypothetical protein [Chlamydiota bacterium]
MISNINSNQLQAKVFDFLDKKIEFPKQILKPNKVKQVSESLIEFKPGEDTSVKIVALKAPVVKIQSLISATAKLVIDTDLLIIDGGYITQPKDWDIRAKDIHLLNVSEKSQWISSLIQNGSIQSSTFNSQAEVDCNFDIPAGPNLDDRFSQIGDDLKKFKDLFKNWR